MIYYCGNECASHPRKRIIQNSANREFNIIATIAMVHNLRDDYVLE